MGRDTLGEISNYSIGFITPITYFFACNCYFQQQLFYPLNHFIPAEMYLETIFSMQKHPDNLLATLARM